MPRRAYRQFLILLGLVLFTLSCKKDGDKQKGSFTSMQYVPHFTVLPDTVQQNKVFFLKASVHLANGCQIFDRLEIEQKENVFELNYAKKEYGASDYSCNERESFILERQRFMMNEPGTYQFNFMDGQGNVAKKRNVAVIPDTPARKYQWDLMLEEGAVSDSELSRLWVHYGQEEIPVANIGTDTSGKAKVKKYDQNHYRLKFDDILIDSMATDSLVYTFLVRQKGGAVFEEFSPLLTNNVIYKGQKELIIKDREP